MNNHMHLNGMNFSENVPIVVRVKHRKIRDYHVFTSDQVSGLYVCSKDAAQVVSEICSAVETMKRLNDKVNCRVQLTQDFFDFLAAQNGSDCEQTEMPLILLAA